MVSGKLNLTAISETTKTKKHKKTNHKTKKREETQPTSHPPLHVSQNG